jgi:hypothetical protein
MRNGSDFLRDQILMTRAPKQSHAEARKTTDSRAADAPMCRSGAARGQAIDLRHCLNDSDLSVRIA